MGLYPKFEERFFMKRFISLFFMFMAIPVIIFADASTLDEAVIDFDLALDVGPIFGMMAVILTAIGAIWAIKKMISLGNKS